jgi:DNA-binding MarR family transcriptional regulator
LIEASSIGVLARALKLSVPTVTGTLHHLVKTGVVEEITGKRRDRIFSYASYFKIISEGTEPLGSG